MFEVVVLLVSEKKWLCCGVEIASLMYHQHQQLKLLALHGWLDNAASFASLAPCLDGVECLIIDLPGHGYSGYFSSQKCYQVIDYIDVVVALIKQYSKAPIALLGHSLGGGIASAIASRHPELVSHLIMIDISGPLSGHMQTQTGSARARSAYSMRIMAQKARDKYYDSLDQMVKVRMRANNLNYDAALPLVTRGSGQNAMGWHWCFDRRLCDCSEFYFSEEQVLSMLSAIEAPVLVVEASDGLLNHQAHHQKRLRAINHLTHHVMAGNHHLHLQFPSHLAARISAFIASHPV